MKAEGVFTVPEACGGTIIEIESQMFGRTEVDRVCSKCRRPQDLSQVVFEDPRVINAQEILIPQD